MWLRYNGLQKQFAWCSTEALTQPCWWPTDGGHLRLSVYAFTGAQHPHCDRHLRAVPVGLALEGLPGSGQRRGRWAARPLLEQPRQVLPRANSK